MLTYALLSLSLLAMRQAPAGTQLHIRLTSAVGTYSSTVGEPVSAVLIAPVSATTGEILLPAGSTLQGTVKHVTRVGLGLIHETAALELEFNDIRLPDGNLVPIASRVLEVDNSRQRVVASGNILGERTTSSVAYRASGYIRTALCWEIHARLAFWAVKTLLIRVPEPEIYYEPGVELTLSLTGSMLAAPEPEQENKLTSAEREQVRLLVSQMPYRATSKTSVPSDLVNMMFVGSREQIAEAFKAAGWTEPSGNMRSRIQNVRAFVEGVGYHAAPMSMLLLNETAPDMSWQKSFNDVSKRHHVRVWKQAETWDGQEIWAGAATRDINFAYMRPGSAWTHRVEENIDLERDKIAYDLQFTSCTDLVDWWDRPGAPLSARNASGDPMSTDGRIAIVRLNDCAQPRLMLAGSVEPALRVHGNYFQRLARRQILSVRSDFYRTNMYWRSYEAVRWTVTAIRHRHRAADPMRVDEPSPTAVAGFRSRALNSSWLR